jgi:glucan phosphorylase
MTDVDHTRPADLAEHSRTGMGAPALQRAITDHLRYSIGRPAAALRPEHYYKALALAVRDRMQDRRVASTQTSLDLGRKVTCYLSAEFLMGPQLGNNLLNPGQAHPRVQAPASQRAAHRRAVPPAEAESRAVDSAARLHLRR